MVRWPPGRLPPGCAISDPGTTMASNFPTSYVDTKDREVRTVVMSDVPTLTVLILCRDEESSIAYCVGEAREFLDRRAIAGEVVVLDNGSRDRSAALAEVAGARVVEEPRAGYGNAIISGIRAARGHFIILGDGDGEHDLSALDPFWEALQNGSDIVVGNRFAGEARPEGMSFLRRYVGNPILSRIGRLLFAAPVRDFQCGLRGLRAESVRALGLQSPGMECASEMIVKAVRKEMRITEAPVRQRRALDPNRSSHLRPWRDGWSHLRLLLMLSPRWVFLYPACLMLAAGAFFMAVPVVYPVEQGGWFGAYTMLFGTAGLVCGTESLVFAMTARLFTDSIGLTDGRWAAWMSNRGVLEKLLVVGSLLLIAGAAAIVRSLFLWAQADAVASAVDIEARQRIAVAGITLVILGVQAILSGFLLDLVSSQRVSGPPRTATRRTAGP